MNPHAENGTKTYRGRALAEVLPRIREELGEDAVIVAQREDAEGGVGGFFAKRVVEVEARPGGAPAGAPTIDVRADDPAGPEAMDVPAAAGPVPPRAGETVVPAAVAPSELAPVLPSEREPVSATEAVSSEHEPPVSLAAELVAAVGAGESGDEAAEPTFEEHLKALLRGAGPPAAPASPPVVVPQVAEDPRERPAVDASEPVPAAESEHVIAIEPTATIESGRAPADGIEPTATTQRATVADQASGPDLLPVADINLLFEVDPEPAPVVEVAPGGEIEILASVEVAPEAEAELPAPIEPDPASVASPTEPGVELEPASRPAPPAVLADRRQIEVRDGLVDAGFTEGLATSLVEETVTHLVPLARDPSLVPLVQKALASRIPTHAVRGAGGRVVGFVGPGGSGKTRCVARLATAYARRSPLPVACVTLRPEDGGAELRGLLAPVGIPIHAEPDAESAAQRVAELRAEAIVILDTPGVSPRAEAEQRVLAVELAQLHADEIHVTVPATVAPRAAREIVAGARGSKPCAIAITHADETEALGTVVELAMDTGLPLSYVGRGHRVDVGLRPADASELAMALTS